MNQLDTSRNSLLFLDGVRGLAAFYVVVSHARMLLWEGYQEGYKMHPTRYSLLNKVFMLLFSFFKEGHIAVLLFFVLSGFVIHLSYARKIKASPEATFDWLNFIYRRGRRIYPPFIFSLLLTWLLDTLGMYLHFPIYNHSTPYTIVNVGVATIHNWPTLLGNLMFLMHGVVPVWGANGPLWSLHYEWWFYMLYPIFFFLSRKSLVGATTAIGVLFVFSFFPTLWFGLFFKNIFGMMLSWWFGVLLADVYTKRIRINFSSLSFLSLAILGVLPKFTSNGVLNDTLYALSFSGLLSFCFYLLESGKSLDWLEKFKPLGDMSYTLYITHFPIFVFLSGWLMTHSSSHELPIHFGWLVLGTLLTLSSAYCCHLYVEKPFLKRSPTQVSAV